jgi:hypothetical protein
MNVCPSCGSSDLRFGSRDPCEGDYYWCGKCGAGPILYPLHYRVKFSKPTLIDADTAAAAAGIRGRAAALDATLFRDREPFDAGKFVSHIVGS